MAALGLHADHFVAATDEGIDALKPHPAGIESIMLAQQLSSDECLFIGDRDDRDGECARRVGMPYLLRRGDRHPSLFKELCGVLSRQ